MNASRALVILSGGQDSTTCLLLAKQQFEDVHAITFDYGQRHAREIEAARDIALLEKVPHEVVQLGEILKGTSPLTDHSEPLEQYSSFQQMEEVIGARVEKTFVPMRNALFLTIAANRAACLNAGVLVTGICAADNANYPDCTPSFARAMRETINEALGLQSKSREERLSIWAPLLTVTKAQSIAMLHTLGGSDVMLAFTHTAYDGQYPPVGADHATVLRAQAFREAGRPDPLVLRAYDEHLMAMPATENYSIDSINIDLIMRIRNIKHLLGNLKAERDAGSEA
jgi:7-cyano-7-deazaguanine synthase